MAGLKLNPAKCLFSQNKCMYLGHMISKDGLSPPPDRVKAIQNFSAPTSVKELRRFLGLVGWFRKFIPNFASIADPLYFLLKKGVRYTWTDEHQSAFELLKLSLVNSAILAFPLFDRQFRLSVDTSSRGIGFMLYQYQPTEDGKDDIRVIRFGSKSLSKWQRSYGPTKLELLGMTYAVLECASYLRGSKFIVECDHQALKPLYQKQLKGAIYERWMAILQEFTFDIVYKPAKYMCVADALSRDVQESNESFDSPDVEDYFFPYIPEKSGQITFPDGTPFCLPSKDSEVNHIQLAQPDLDDGYDADTDDNYGHIPMKLLRSKQTFIPNIVQQKDVSHALRTFTLPEQSDSDTTICSLPETENTLVKNVSEEDISNVCQQDPHTDHINSTVNSDNDTNNRTIASESDTNNSNHIDASSAQVRNDTLTTSSDLQNEVSETEDISQHIHQLLSSTNMSLDDIAKLQRSDPHIKTIMDYLEQDVLPTSQKLSRKILLEASDYLISHDALFHTRIAKSKRALQVPISCTGIFSQNSHAIVP
ncbi:hypothetical protein FSP39_000262 [Pinctada imbricata]|uniref:Reverse transcriptase/retrotransposon-derived protein RNase H-like domain-containing protein n=1 Tax=Pinctada imbricata TaxID=66713 RepID=A0AA89BUF0_PINIB|nr:hypothetical protein FSP39_000262 [Pinctada imbricata]